PGEQDEQAHHPLAAELLLQCQAEHVGEDDDDQLGDEGEEEGVAQRAPETGIVERGAEILQSHVVAGGGADGDVADREPEREEEGYADDGADVDQRRRDQHLRQRALVVGDPHSGLGGMRRPLALSKNLRSFCWMENSYAWPSVTATCTVKGRLMIIFTSGA